MAYIRKSPTYYVIKVAGDNLSNDKDHFVATNKGYTTFEAAVEVARELSSETPDNRYYVCVSTAGFMSHAPKTEEAIIVEALRLPER